MANIIVKALDRLRSIKGTQVGLAATVTSPERSKTCIVIAHKVSAIFIEFKILI